MALEPGEARGGHGGRGGLRRWLSGLGPPREKIELCGTVRQPFALWIGQKTRWETGVEGADGDLVSVDGKKRPPSAAADFI